MSNSPLYTLLDRNQERFYGKKLVIAGVFFDPNLLLLAKNAQRCSFLIDDYVTAKAMAAMVSSNLDQSLNQKLSYKHVDLYFSDVSQVAPGLEEFDALILSLSKSKQENLRILETLKPKLAQDCLIYTAGANDGGGRSADAFLKSIGETYKLDSARKCTLFCCKYQKDFHLYDKPLDLTLKQGEVKLELGQLPGVFSTGALDEGSALLLEALEGEPLEGRILDLGCGCGVLGIALAKAGAADVTLTDVSAKALFLACHNVKLNACQERCDVKASDMLTDVGSFEAIVTNPPFHQGVTTTKDATLNMIATAKRHLTQGGRLYLVGNTHLGYGKYLKAAFDTVEIILSNNRFTVFKAS